MWRRWLGGLVLALASATLPGAQPVGPGQLGGEDPGTAEGTLRSFGPNHLSVDRGCWNEVFTVEVCCLASFNASSDLGCWSHDEQWEYCCRSFVIWNPPPAPPQLRQLHDTALGYVLQSSLHEGMTFGRIAAALGYTRCVEIGVFGGTWSEFFLVFSTSVDRRLDPDAKAEVKEYTLIDLWRSQGEDLGDGALGTNLYSAKAMSGALGKLRRFWPRVRFVQQPSRIASRLFDESSLDFIFVDAGHDGCSVQEDLEAWWPKLHRGGLMAGDDYLDAETVQEVYGEHQDWSTCADGRVRPGAVLGAVNDFAREKGLGVMVFRMLGASLSPQWLIFKPP